MKVERRSIHAITQPGRLRAVVENVAEVAAAAAAVHFGAGHEKAAVGLRLDRLLDRRRKARPAGSAVELGVGGEQRLAATGTMVDAFAVLLVERARSSTLGAVVTQDPILRRRQLAPPLLLAQYDREFFCRRLSSASEAAQQTLCHHIPSPTWECNTTGYAAAMPY